jgi:hypothetical protein
VIGSGTKATSALSTKLSAALDGDAIDIGFIRISSSVAPSLRTRLLPACDATASLRYNLER